MCTGICTLGLDVRYHLSQSTFDFRQLFGTVQTNNYVELKRFFFEQAFLRNELHPTKQNSLSCDLRDVIHKKCRNFCVGGGRGGGGERGGQQILGAPPINRRRLLTWLYFLLLLPSIQRNICAKRKFSSSFSSYSYCNVIYLGVSAPIFPPGF